MSIPLIPAGNELFAKINARKKKIEAEEECFTVEPTEQQSLVIQVKQIEPKVEGSGENGNENGSRRATVRFYGVPDLNNEEIQEPTRNRSKSFHHTVRVVHPYSAQVEGELTINPGDIIEVVRMDHSGWWEGLCQETGQRGVFPSNFTVIKDDSQDVGLESQEFVVALFDFDGNDAQGELSFCANDKIYNVQRTSEYGDEWWRGTIVNSTGERKTGLFPANYVGEHPTEEEDHSETVSSAPSVRQRIVDEIMDTEKKYIDYLMLISAHFIQPLRKCVQDGSPIIEANEIDQIFSNIEHLSQFNCQLFADLNTSLRNHDSIGKAFYNFAPFFKMYAGYVSNHETARQLLENLKKRSSFLSFVQETESNPQLRGQSLESLLIMPVQRVPRYQLLLRELLKNTPEDHHDFVDIQRAMGKVEEAATHINEMIRHAEASRALVEVEKRFGGSISLVKASRRFVMEGELAKMCRKGPRTYTFFLFNDLIIYAEKKTTGLKLHRQIELSDCSVRVLSNPMIQHAFELLSPAKSFVIQACSDQERDKWLKAIDNLVIDIQSDIQRRVHETRRHSHSESHIGRRSSAAPIWIPDNLTTKCVLCEKDFSVINRKHHCRNCGNIVCNRCSTGRLILPNIDGKKPQRACDTCISRVQEDTEKSEESGIRIVSRSSWRSLTSRSMRGLSVSSLMPDEEDQENHAN